MWFLNSKAPLASIRTYTLISLEIEILSVWIPISLHIHISLLNCFREKKKRGIGRAMRKPCHGEKMKNLSNRRSLENCEQPPSEQDD